MLKVKNKYRIVVAAYVFLPTSIIIALTADSPVFLDHVFQTALTISICLSFFCALFAPFLPGLGWLFMKQLQMISSHCMTIKRGEYTYFQLSNQPINGNNENEMLCLMRDMNWMTRQIANRENHLEAIVDRRTRELLDINAQLREARDAAEASLRIKDEFISTMSHEIRTPMNAIIGMTELIQNTELDSRQQDFFNTIQSSSKSLLDIINNILDFSRMEAGKLETEKIPVNITGLLEEIADMFQGSVMEKNIKLFIDVQKDTLPFIRADPFRLRQILVNLISNAFKFTENGEICVSVRCEYGKEGKNRIIFYVKDTGIGMEQETLSRLFMPFSQADSSTSRKFGGSGLGLAICRKLVHLMDGEIGVESIPRKGSCFFFSFDLEVCKCDKTHNTEPPVILKNRTSPPVNENMISVKRNTDASAGTKENPAPFQHGDILSMLEKLDILLAQNSLKAKSFMNEISSSLTTALPGNEPGKLEGEISRFDFKKARQTIETIKEKIDA